MLYGTETGNSMEIAQHVGRMCQRLRFPTLIEEMDDVKLVRHAPLFVFTVCSAEGVVFAVSLASISSRRHGGPAQVVLDWPAIQ